MMVQGAPFTVVSDGTNARLAASWARDQRETFKAESADLAQDEQSWVVREKL